MEPWLEQLHEGDPDAAWDSFMTRYRPLVFSAIRHYVTDPDDVMDVFAQVCEALRRNNLARLRKYPHDGTPQARFSTWLVAVVRNQTVDWLRHRDGRHRRRAPDQLSPVQQRIHQHVFIEKRSHQECFHLLTVADRLPLSYHEFSTELAATYRLASPPPPPPQDRRQVVPEETVAADPSPPDAETARHDAAMRLETVLATLSAEDRLAVRLFVVDELSAAEVAQIVGWPSAKTVYNRVARALKSVRARLTEAGLTRDDL